MSFRVPEWMTSSVDDTLTNRPWVVAFFTAASLQIDGISGRVSSFPAIFWCLATFGSWSPWMRRAVRGNECGN